VGRLSGEKIEDDAEAHWANLDGDKNIDQYNLPKTSAQYLIDFDDLPELYRELSIL